MRSAPSPKGCLRMHACARWGETGSGGRTGGSSRNKAFELQVPSISHLLRPSVRGNRGPLRAVWREAARDSSAGEWFRSKAFSCVADALRRMALWWRTLIECCGRLSMSTDGRSRLRAACAAPAHGDRRVAEIFGEISASNHPLGSQTGTASVHG